VKRTAEDRLGTGIIPESVDKKETILPKNHAIRWRTRKCLTQILGRQCPGSIFTTKLTVQRIREQAADILKRQCAFSLLL